MRDQESPPFISAAAATGSPIIAPGGTYPPQVYQLSPQVAYVQSPGGMVPQPMVQQVGQTFYTTEKFLKNPSRLHSLSNFYHHCLSRVHDCAHRLVWLGRLHVIASNVNVMFASIPQP